MKLAQPHKVFLVSILITVMLIPVNAAWSMGYGDSDHYDVVVVVDDGHHEVCVEKHDSHVNHDASECCSLIVFGLFNEQADRDSEIGQVYQAVLSPPVASQFPDRLLRPPTISII